MDQAEDNAANAAVSDGGESPIYIVGEELSPAHYFALLPVGLTSSLFSLVGSIRILCLIRGAYRQKKSRGLRHAVLNPYHRFMVGISIHDIIFSFSCLLQPFLVPADITANPTAIGTTETCTLVGFMLVFGMIGNSLYNLFLGLNFWLVIVWHWNNQAIYRWLERPAHCLAWGFPLCIALLAALTENINPGSVSLTCTTVPYPPGCSVNEEEECRGGGPVALMVDAAATASVALPIMASFVTTLWVYAYYRRETRKLSLRQSLQTQEFSSAFAQPQQAKRMKTMTFRAIFYFVAFVGTFFLMILLYVLSGIGPEVVPPSVNYACRVLVYIFMPLQSFFNCILLM